MRHALFVALTLSGSALPGLLAGCQTERVALEAAAQAQAIEVVEEHWPGGELHTRREVTRGADGVLVNHGVYTCWHVNGVKSYESTYVHGELDGVERSWHQNGQLWVEQHYDHGRRHGPRYTWDEEGRKRKEEHYFADQPDGHWQIWNADGKLKWEAYFDRGVPVSGG